ncbi:MAG: response regulator [Magnetococcales bacterium]|nr:response regulator [Magnetococcales bacterium]
MNVLIVEDIEENRIILARFLTSYAQCDMAKNGQEAVHLFETALRNGSPYDLVLLDIVMPVMDGQAALKQMRAMEQEFRNPHDPETVILMTTSVDAQSEIVEALEQGHCTDYLNKPISRAKLLVKLSELKLIPQDWWKQDLKK